MDPSDVFTVTSQEKKFSFTNEVYVVNGTHVVKFCKGDEEGFAREAIMYQKLHGKLPVPTLVTFDDSKKKVPTLYMIYEYVPGETLYAVWPILSDVERESMVEQLCALIRKLASCKLDLSSPNWHDYWYEKLITRLEKATSLLTPEEIKKIGTYIEEHHHTLREAKLVPVHPDLHFDNVIVKDKKIVCLLDFERIRMASLDFNLDCLRRTQRNPETYAESDDVPKEQYSKVMEWTKKYAPELFDFPDVDHRLHLYAVAGDLSMLQKFPKSESMRRRLWSSIHNE